MGAFRDLLEARDLLDPSAFLARVAQESGAQQPRCYPLDEEGWRRVFGGPSVTAWVRLTWMQ
eukprot:6651912-Alexandrium_andersonii.AAC.1